MSKLRFENGFINTYLDMVEETESPRIFHIWCALAGVAACLGRRVWLQDGNSQLYANMFVALVGPPGVRKSTAMNIMHGYVKEVTGVRFAPDDTGGQRQGLLKAMQNDDMPDETKNILAEIDAADSASLEALASARLATDTDPRDLHTMFVCASEFNSFLGRNALDMLTFLLKMWDGEEYTYRLKNEELTLTNPLLSLIGCTTPTNIATALPPEAIGQGFMSRVILVHANEKHKNVPRRIPFDPNLEQQIKNLYQFLFYDYDGEITETTAAAKFIDELYGTKVEIDDPRFLYYIERRHTHLRKLSMVLAASRRSKYIETQDVREAQRILSATEKAMPDALGEYGMNKTAAARQRMLEFLQHYKGAVDQSMLYAIMARDMTFVEFSNAIADMVNSGKIVRVQTNNGPGYTYKEKRSTLIDEVLEDIADGPEEPKSNVIPLTEMKRG